MRATPPLWREDHEAQAQLRLLGYGLLPTTAYVYPPGFHRQPASWVRKFEHLAVRRPLVELFLRSSSRFVLLLVLLTRYTLPVISFITLQVLFYFLVCSSVLALVRHVSPFTSWRTSLRTNTFRGRIFPFPRACGFLPLPNSVTGLAIGYIGDSYGLSLVM